MIQNMRIRHGFTLIELMIVIVIIGILTTIGIFAFQSSQLKARDSRRKSDLEQVTRALEMYYNDNGAYPLSNSGGEIVGCGSPNRVACPWGTPFSTTVTYMVKLPKDPNASLSYYYEKSGNGYRLYAHLENIQDDALPSNGSTYDRDCGIFKCSYVVNSLNIPLPTTIAGPTATVAPTSASTATPTVVTTATPTTVPATATPTTRPPVSPI